MKNLKIHWAFTLGALVLGFAIAYFIFKCDPRTKEGDFLHEQKEDLIEDFEDIVKEGKKNDSTFKANDKKENDIIKKNYEKTKKYISNGIDPVLYDSLVRSNRYRGAKRQSDN